MSEPVLVARSRGYLWFPTLAKTGDGRLLAVMNNYSDAHTANSTCLTAWSDDGALTWSAPKAARYGGTSLLLPTGELRLLPYYLSPVKDGLAAPYQVVAKGGRDLRVVEEGVRVTGWPKPVALIDRDLNLGGFVFNGQSLVLDSGAFFTTLYGRFEGDELYSLVGAESKDGARWVVKSIIADGSCGFKGSGPSESAVCRLKDGRLMCIFRTRGALPYGQTFSSDQGRTWGKPEMMADMQSVQPSLVVLADGAVVLTGGRPGVFAWLNPDGTGKGWHPIDLVANHNAVHPADPISDSRPGGNTSAYTEVVSLGDGTLRIIYDRLPQGWKPIPPESADTNSVWVIRLTIEHLQK